MDFVDYQKAARRTQNKHLDYESLTRHALFGLGAEVGEVQSIFQKSYQGHEVSTSRIIDEAGDVLWMLSELADACGFTLDEVARHNMDKLRARYPDGFDADRSVNREE